ncbi:non-ribosomal peptide synthetase [Chryseobacterium gregarium]|uniref:non-ribosomal peptide synthetase n=1 Tax=Chryseobacterium gregarium TaxID=456299 RepID=UPI000406F4BC|nr:non-ribosomal peptide synthetase [Chryseobacterium gregarium]
MEKIEGYKLSENQINYVSNQANNADCLYNQVIIKVKDQCSDEELTLHINEAIKEHEVLFYTLFSNNDLNNAIQYKDHKEHEIKRWYFDTEIDKDHFIKVVDNDFDSPYHYHENKALKIGVGISGEARYIAIRIYSLFGDLYSCTYLSNEIIQRIKGSYEHPEKIEFYNYCSWQNELLAEPEEEAKLFWETYNADPENKIIPFGKKIEAFKPVRKNIISVDKENYGKLAKDLAENDLTTESYLLLCLNHYFSQFSTDDKDLTIGYVNQDRPYEELAHTIGYVNSMVALNLKVHSENLALSEAIREIKKEVEAVKSWADYFTLNRKKQNTVYFKYCFEYVNTGKILSQSNADIIETYSVQDIFDCKLTVVDSGETLSVDFYYNNDIFSPVEKEIIEEQFKEIYDTLLYQQKPGLTSADKKIIALANSTAANFEDKNSIVHLFESQVAETPEADAIEFDGRSLSYQELNKKSNQLANYLKTHYHIQANDLVCIRIPRSEQMIISIIGILKSGAAYVPVDCDYPAERIQYIIEDSGAKVVIDDAFLSEFDKQKEDYSKDNPSVTIGSGDSAYVIYTSGTTGSPKGVSITHSNILNYTAWSNDFYFTAEERGNWGLFTSISFDLSGTAVFCSLTRGGKLFLGNSEDDTLVSLLSMLGNEEVDVLKLTPSHISLLKNTEVTSSGLSKIILGGEKLHADHIQTIRSIGENIDIYDEYGPTETTIGCIARKIEQSDENIGQPISNTQVYIRNEKNDLVPVGVPGEICIAGAGVAKGYLHNPELTNEKFIENPFSSGSKMYRTGDLGSWLADGNIEYLGRIDDQVKIRGYRVELGEIDSHVLSYNSTIKTVVTEVKEHEGDAHLVVYFVSDEQIDKKDLSAYLEKKMPQYMLPDFYVQLEQIPLTNNGKVDRKKLRNVAPSDLIKQEYVAPRNDAEKQLKEIWEEILGVENIGVTDNFFALGGHSLILIRIINKIKITFNKTISIKDFMENPRIDLVAQRISGDANVESFEPIRNVEEAKYYPITAAQYRFWVIQQNYEASATYNVSEAYKLKGDLESSQLEESFRLLVNRYEILRTIFLNINGTVFQQVLPFDKIDFKIESIDLTSSPNKDQELTELLNTKKINFRLDEFPLFKVYLIKVDTDEYILWFNTHHIICDGWSSNLFAAEIIKTYNYLVRNESPDLPDLKIQYKDYADWVNKKNVEKSRDFWIKTLSDDIKRVDLPFSGKRKKYQTFNGDKFVFVIPGENVKKVKHFLQGNNISLFTYLVACTKVLLNKYTHQNDVIIGTTFSGRDHPDLENQLGLFLNTLPLRSNVDNNDSFNTFLIKEKKNIIDAFSNGNYPFDQILNEINYQKDIRKSALYDVSVVLNNHNNMALFDGPKEMDDLVIESYPITYDISKNDIEFNFSESDHGLLGIATYNTDLYDRESVVKFVDHLIKMIESLVDSADQPLSELNYLSSADQEVLLKEFNDTSVSYPENQSILSLFENQVNLTPESIAVVFEDLGLSYTELNEKASSLALQMRDGYGIKKGDQVGVMLNRGENQIVSILGILKLGAIYVPVDANLPESRKEVTTSGLSLLITESYYFFDLDFYAGESFSIDLEFTEEDASGFTSTVLEKEDIAYIIYTSGSTGEPKGVLNTHGGILNTMLFQKEFFEVSSYENVAQFASFSFDASISEIFMTLLSGKSLHILSDSVRKDAYAFEEYVNSHSIDLVTLPPAFFSLLNVEKLQNLKGLITAGESAVIGKTKEYLKYGTFYNAYGPTETSICATVHKLEKGSDLTSTTIPIGQPIANTQIYILDEYGHLVPAGVSGEMYISGDGLAQGYLNREDLTEEKFVENPFIPDTKMYRTGDLGKWLPDGTIEYMGRIDYQVKIRGHRIELGEIDSQVLSYNPAIQTAVAEVKEHDGDKSLVVYYVSDTPIDKQDLARHLESKLPQYMLPGFYVELDQIPLTSNGKVDRKNLPEVSSSDLIKNEYVAATSGEERVLVSVCEQILKHNPISIRDNYYNLGGDSIKSIQIVSRLRQQGYSLKVEHILQYPVLEELARYMTTDVAKIDQSAVTGDSILTPIQRYFFESEGITNKNHYNQSVILKSRERLSGKILESSIKTLVSHHDALRMVYSQKDREWNQHNAGIDGAHYRLESFDIKSGSESEELSQLQQIGEDLQSSIDIESGILFHAGHVSMSDGDRIILVVHHLVMDGVSWRILLEDLGKLYESGGQGLSSELPSKTDSFQSWGKALDEYSRSPELSKERLYWEGVESENYTALATDYPSEGKQVLDKSIGFSLSSDSTKLLQTRAGRKYSAEINDVLLTGLALALQDQFGITRTKVLMEGHGREVMNTGLDISRTIGWFTSVYPFSLDISNNNQPALVSVKEGLRSIPNKGIGYGILNYLDNQFISSGLASVQFNYLGDFNEIGDPETQGKASLFDYSSENIGSSVDSANLSTDLLLDVSGMTVNGVMSINIRFSDKLFTENTIQKLLAAYQAHLEAIVKESEDSSVILTPSDLTYKGLSFSTIEEISKENDIEDIYELSPMQQGLYFHWLVDSHGSVYFMQTSYLVKSSELQLSLVERAFGILLNRHTILRTSFENRYGGVPLQIVHKKARVDFKHLILESELELDNIKQGDINRGFNLGEPTQMRLLIVELPNGYYEFIWSHHHIIMDGWCLSILINDFTTILNSLEHEKEINLPEPKKYSSYIKWLGEVNKEVTLSYWESYLEGVSSPTIIPFKKEYTSSSGAKVLVNNKIKIEGDSFRRIESQCKNIGITINTYIQGVWGYLLSRYNGSEDAVFGAVVSGRPPELEDVENMVGLFINTVPVRVKYKKENTVKEFFHELHTQSIQSSPYHYSNLSDIQTISGLGSNMINNIIVFENYPVQDSIVESYIENENSSSIEEIKNVEVVDETNYYFLITVFPSEDAVVLDIKYDASAFDTVLMDNIESHFSNLLKNIFVDADKKIFEMDYLSLAEKKHLLEDFNNKEVNYPSEENIISLFESQVTTNPDHVAVVFEETKLTYWELNQQSNQLAHYLREKYNIKRDDLICIQLPRSEKMIISILGILKSGGAYVPIDNDYPQDRIDYIIEDTKSKIVIDEKFWLAFDLLKDNYPEENLDTHIQPTNLAYIIYTSGTTGNPKGVMIEHKNVVRLFFNDNALYDFNRSDSWTLFHSYNFDFSVWESYGALLFGGTLHVISKRVVQDVGAFLNYLITNKITILNQTPAAFYNLAEYDKLFNHEELALRYIIFGGEALNPYMLKDWQNKYPGIKMINMYGITETTVHVTYKELTVKDTSSVLSNIGKPIPTLNCYILDDQKYLVPAGVVGELYISGSGLSRGYLNRPDLTEEKFVENPFISGSKIYRTGDLGRWLPDGNIEYLGRIDHQVKIRGHRIELGEIDSHVINYSDRIKTVVTEVKEHEGDKNLVVYYVAEGNIDKDDLTKYLESKLPYHMLPSFYVELESIPLTSNGKIDRKLLPEVSAGDLIKNEYVAPANPMQCILVEVCEQILKHNPISIKDNYYNLGGDSIKSIQIVSKLRQQGYTLKVEHILQYPVLEEMSNHIVSEVSTIEQSIVSGNVNLTPIQRYFFESEEIVNKNHYNQSIVLKSTERLSGSILENCIKQLVIHHDALRMIYTNEKNEWRQSNADTSGKHCRYEYFDISSCSTKAEELERLQYIGTSLQNSIDITSGILFHVGHVSMSDGDRILLILHHLVVDGVSWRILLEDLNNLYDSAVLGNAHVLPAKTHSFQSWSAALEDYSTSISLNKERSYWENMESEEYPAIPTDYPLLEQHVPDNSIGFSLDKDSTHLLQTYAGRKHNTEVNHVLLTALAVSLKEHFGISKTKLIMEGHGRENISSDMDVSRTVGWFTSVYPFLLDISDHSRSAIASVKEGLGNVPQKGIGYGILHYLQERIVSSSEPRIIFSYMGSFDAAGGTDNKKVMFDFSSEDIGSTVSDENLKTDVLIDVSGIIVSGVLNANIRYSKNVFHEATIQKLAQLYEKNIIKILEEDDDENINEWSYGNEMIVSPNQYHLFRNKYSSVNFDINVQSFDENSFEKKLRACFSKFPSLMMKYEKNGSQIIQQYVSEEDLVIKLQNESLQIRSEDEIKTIGKEFIFQPFDMFNGELIRVFAVRTETSGISQATVFFGIHHSLLDDYSANTVKNELEAYFNSNEEITVRPHYFNFIDSQEKFLKSDEGIKIKEKQIKSLLELPLHDDENSDKEDVYFQKFIVQEAFVKDEDFLHLQKVSQKVSLPLNAFCLSIFLRIITDYNNPNKGLFGMLSSNRENSEYENMIGVLTNLIMVPYPDFKNYSVQEIMKNYGNMIQCRTEQKIPYEMIRKDIKDMDGRDIEKNIFGFYSHLSQNTEKEYASFNESTEEITEFNGINLKAFEYSNGVLIQLSQPVSTSRIDFSKYIKEFMDFVKIH